MTFCSLSLNSTNSVANSWTLSTFLWNIYPFLSDWDKIKVHRTMNRTIRDLHNWLYIAMSCQPGFQLSHLTYLVLSDIYHNLFEWTFTALQLMQFMSNFWFWKERPFSVIYILPPTRNALYTAQNSSSFEGKLVSNFAVCYAKRRKIQ